MFKRMFRKEGDAARCLDIMQQTDNVCKSLRKYHFEENWLTLVLKHNDC